ncbi:MAG: hypothetical protein LBT32_10100 [Peptococcaceae bacterium]|jgi:Ni2+-binding GTPase involved in maturation of urease and hydrogenase|nr:hypothetical protein [Peptococcaceae bacterium]
MKLITIAGPPSAGKTSVILRAAEHLSAKNRKIGILKFDALATADHLLYQKAGLPVQYGLSGGLCPDHYFISNIETGFLWGVQQQFDYLISESAGLCNRCSPYITGFLAISVVDSLSGAHTPKKTGPMLKFADIVVITKSDIVSQAEREVFAFHVRLANPIAMILFVNGITGQGAFGLSKCIEQAPESIAISGETMRFTMPSSLCTYCTGETSIGEQFCRGNLRKMRIAE